MSLMEEADAFSARIGRIAERMERHLGRLRVLEETLDAQLADLQRQQDEDEFDTQSESDSESDDSTVDLRELGLINGVRFADDEVVINQPEWQEINFESEDEDDDATVAMNYTPFDYFQDGEYDSDASTVVADYREPWHSPRI